MFGNRIGTVLTAAAAVVIFAVTPANAADSTVTFATTGGVLSVSVAPAAALNTGSATPGTTISGLLGAVTVTDARGTAEGWAIGVYSTTGFTATGSPSIPNTGITYTPGAATGTVAPGTPAITPGAAGSPGNDRGSARTVYTYANATAGGNRVSWVPTLAVAIPSTARPGALYSGKITYRVM
ncbi:hypothetical protein Lesp02_23480 [Lentzea sp. NBRC 105346]|uniref:WxL domain-containing protein n=1 Tax=Lentzea sp. NBRC 105346 TaxID=3032205 RepID=UPI0024A2B135|nr:WxL domain-containing protein [Lentzea sp. NBRC 105346]GLZ30158.1 hypothetical protein Lesp02_23480 [Lentzea sp. NBRC 105346]